MNEAAQREGKHYGACRDADVPSGKINEGCGPINDYCKHTHCVRHNEDGAGERPKEAVLEVERIGREFASYVEKKKDELERYRETKREQRKRQYALEKLRRKTVDEEKNEFKLNPIDEEERPVKENDLFIQNSYNGDYRVLEDSESCDIATKAERIMRMVDSRIRNERIITDTVVLNYIEKEYERGMRNGLKEKYVQRFKEVGKYLDGKTRRIKAEIVQKGKDCVLKLTKAPKRGRRPKTLSEGMKERDSKKVKVLFV